MTEKNLATTVADLSTELRVFMVEMKPFIVAVTEHTRVLNGNGQDGLRTRVTLLEDCRDNSRRAFRYIWSAIVAIGSTLLGWILSGLVQRG